jgi:branched-chain amino acid transport system permease protein
MKRNTWLALAGVALLAALPLLLPQGLLNASIQMLIAALFACAFSLLSGQAGMLSFGHAAYFGVGAFATIHAMNAFGGAGLLPTPLLPLIGAAAGLAFGVLAGWFATKRTGTYFAMITLAIAELLHSLAPHMKGLFGGEAGISSMRMPAWGLTFGSISQVYYLTLAWVVLSVALLYLYTLTPIGRLTLGLRENGHRLKFLGYNVHGLSVSAFAVSAAFSGLAGALQVLSNEAANYVVFDPTLSAAVVLNSYIGGVGAFLGPAFGAALMTFFGYAVSDLTQSWLLYQGTLFVLVMMFMPAGMMGVFAAVQRLGKRFSFARLLPILLVALAAAVLLAAGTAFVIELLQRVFSQDYRAMARTAAALSLPPVAILGRAWLPGSLVTWIVPAASLIAGAALAWFARARIAALEKGPAPALDPATYRAGSTEVLQ